MANVTVHVYCKDCSDIDDDGDIDHPEMIGADILFENQDARTQSRDYHCPNCDSNINIVLDFRGN